MMKILVKYALALEVESLKTALMMLNALNQLFHLQLHY